MEGGDQRPGESDRLATVLGLEESPHHSIGEDRRRLSTSLGGLSFVLLSTHR